MLQITRNEFLYLGLLVWWCIQAGTKATYLLGLATFIALGAAGFNSL
ncbi:MAG: hypothetical protein LRY75_16560 [Shewanella xiamenensis]|uniref:Uncharacterized protein n=2 Tax=Shewanella TaxID=22 RepID=A0AAE4Q2I7_9GAMM|nr:MULTISPECIES: hypothetical protein [Shewanella]MCD8552097.1 hypothetical protein [Shewanella xiamenensis]MCD8560385.1 hypothetical protein [Shewanella xiamenensis]MCK7657662.1 hypothetical protein [Shewanella sp. JNE4-2]MCT8858149.1 hypothetical protein [Shewanella xiamenensis]MDH0450964.1 hypothetical protein [Shewanella sp. GD04112]